MRTGIGTSIIGILCNLVLSASKIAVGLIFGLVSVVADGFNNLSDMGGGLVSLISFCISEKPADKKHPFGHRRAEYVATMAMGFIILVVAVELFRESIAKIIDGTLTSGSAVIYAVLGVSVAVKASMFLFYRITAKKICSETLRAASIDSLSDCIATSVVIIGVIIAQYTGKSADGWIGIIVALFIAWQGIKILFEQGSKLIGQAADASLTAEMMDFILSADRVLGVHDLHVFSYGEGFYFATVHISIDAAIPSLEAHAIIDGLEADVLAKFGINLTAHFDPVDLNDEEAQELEKKIAAAISNVIEGAELHDFRLVRSTHTRVVFDVKVPYSVKRKDDALCKELENIVAEICDYQSVITIDRD